MGSTVAAGLAAGSRGGCSGERGASPAPSEPAACPLPSCEITTREYCEFMHGYFHEEATLCSQVSGAGDTMLAAGSRIAVLMPKGFIVSYHEWDVVGMGGGCKVQGLAQLSAGLVLPLHAHLAGVGQEEM